MKLDHNIAVALGIAAIVIIFFIVIVLEGVRQDHQFELRKMCLEKGGTNCLCEEK